MIMVLISSQSSDLSIKSKFILFKIYYNILRVLIKTTTKQKTNKKNKNKNKTKKKKTKKKKKKKKKKK